jgi:hypothetical protein
VRKLELHNRKPDPGSMLVPVRNEGYVDPFLACRHLRSLVPPDSRCSIDLPDPGFIHFLLRNIEVTAERTVPMTESLMRLPEASLGKVAFLFIEAMSSAVCSVLNPLA